MTFTATATKAISALAALLLLTGPGARAQQPSQDQIAAIRASCRSDFMANCSGVTPGGKDALECLKRNLGKLSGSCQTAVSAITPPPAAPPTAAAPARRRLPPPRRRQLPVAIGARERRPASKPQAAKPAPAAKLTARPPPAAAPAAPPAVAAAPPHLPIQPLVLRRCCRGGASSSSAICQGDAERLCSGLPPIGPAVLDCLAVKAADLSPTCYEALARVSRP